MTWVIFMTGDTGLACGRVWLMALRAQRLIHRFETSDSGAGIGVKVLSFPTFRRFVTGATTRFVAYVSLMRKGGRLAGRSPHGGAPTRQLPSDRDREIMALAAAPNTLSCTRFGGIIQQGLPQSDQLCAHFLRATLVIYFC